jgi:hypothetical protein
MRIIERLKIIAVAALLKIVAIFGHGLVKKPLKPADVLIRGSVKVAEFSLGQMDDNNRTASGPNVVIDRPVAGPPPVASARQGPQKGKNSKRPF